MEGVESEKPKECILKEGFRAKRFKSKEGRQDKHIEKVILFLISVLLYWVFSDIF